MERLYRMKKAALDAKTVQCGNCLLSNLSTLTDTAYHQLPMVSNGIHNLLDGESKGLLGRFIVCVKFLNMFKSCSLSRDDLNRCAYRLGIQLRTHGALWIWWSHRERSK